MIDPPAPTHAATAISAAGAPACDPGPGGSVGGVRGELGRFRPPAWATGLRVVVPPGIGLLLAWVLYALVTPQLGGFGSNLVLFAGINIILAVSLNIVNGYAGQFSIGHAGFMALGGYAAAAVVYYGSF